MKRVYSIFLCAIIMAVYSINVQAQEKQGNHQRISRQQLAEAQAKYISHELALDETTSQKFIATFCDYQKEVWALGPQIKQDKRQPTTDAKAEEAIKRRMERSRMILDLREKYYKKYSQFLTQKQIERVYELESKVMRRMARRSANINTRVKRQRSTPLNR